MGKKSGFDLKELMNKRSLEKTGQQDTEYIEDDMEIITLDVYDLVPSEDNFYSMEDIESLKSSIVRFGLLQPILIRPDRGDGKHDIKAGHRRRLACISLVEDENLEKYRYVPCVIKREEEYASAETEDEKRLNAVLERLELIEANMFRDKSEWEKMEEALQQEELIEELRKVIKLSGRTRTILKEFTDGKIKEAQMGRYKVIKKNLCAELMEEFKLGNIGISVTYDAARMTPEHQKQAFDILRGNGTLTGEDIKKLKRLEEQKTPEQTEHMEEQTAWQQDEEYEPDCGPLQGKMNPPEEEQAEEQSTYKETKQEKTEEQRYDEEQKRIDRDTRRKLKEQADEEKMKVLPSEEKKEKEYIRLAADTFERVETGDQRYLILQGKYKTGDNITLLEFKGGIGTGKTIDVFISHMDDDTTSTAIAEGYNVISVKSLDN
ncbi:hypothetical protein DWW31_18345 [Clostridium sp. AF15-17LB]|nr:hypothetical protein DWW31_18345 [Clostridium sp. AF15-17LB]